MEKKIMTHPQIEQTIAHYHDLSETERRQVDRHLTDCDSCAAWLTACQSTDKALSGFLVQRQSQVNLVAPDTHSLFSAGRSGQNRFRLPQFSNLFGAIGRLTGVLLIAGVVVWFALTLRGRAYPAGSIRTTPAGTTIVEAGRELLFIVTPDPDVLVLDPVSLAQVGNLSLNVTEGPAVAPNGDLYFIAGFYNLVVLEMATGQQRVISTVTDPLRIQTTATESVLAVTPDGRRIVVSHYWTPPEGGAAEEITEFWRTVVDVESGALLATIPQAREHVRTSDTAACLGAYMLPAYDNQSLYELCLWNRGPLLRTLDLQQGAIVNVVRDDDLSEAYFGALSSDGQRLYVLTRSGQISIFNLPDLTLEETVTLAAGGGPAHIQDYGGRAVFSPDGSLLYLNDRDEPDTLYAIDVATWQTVAQARLAEGESVHNLTLSADGTRLYLLSGSYPHEPLQLSMWDTTTLFKQQVVIMPETVYEPARILAVNLSPAAFTRLFPATTNAPSP
jgi:DNA-binding beta-propeller fold protein YncE